MTVERAAMGHRTDLEEGNEYTFARANMARMPGEDVETKDPDADVSDHASTSSPHPQESKASGRPSSTWTITQKWMTVSTASMVCFAVGMNATGILAATEEISSEFNINLEHFDYSFFLVTAWNSGAAIVPLFVLPLMEDLGIRPIYYTMYLLFVVFVIVQAVAPNFATLIVARLIAGSAGGVLQNCVDGIAADAWGEDIHSRALCLSMYIFALLGGVTIGPVVGGAIIKSLSWRWILYVQLIIYGVLFPYTVFTLGETRKNTITSPKESVSVRLKAAMNGTVLRAVRLLFTEFVVGSFTLLSSFAFGTVFVLTQSIPQVFVGLYDWPTWQTGVIQISIFLGELIGVILCIFQDKIIYPRYAYRGGRSLQAIPEPRLYTVIPCSILGLTAGFFIYGWTAYASITWVLPSLGLMLIGVGIMVTIQAVTTYVTDCYASHASSAISGVAFGENILAAFLPLATRDMYNTLGFQWASSLLGFAALVLSMAPIVLVLNGEKIRRKSKFAG